MSNFEKITETPEVLGAFLESLTVINSPREDGFHKLVIKPYMPKVNDLVLVLYFPVFNGDGVILGGIKPWK